MNCESGASGALASLFPNCAPPAMQAFAAPIASIVDGFKVQQSRSAKNLESVCDRPIRLGQKFSDVLRSYFYLLTRFNNRVGRVPEDESCLFIQDHEFGAFNGKCR